MGILSWFSGNNEERTAIRELEKKRKAADEGLITLIHRQSEFVEGDYENIRRQIDDGGNVNITGYQRGCEGYTLLHVAATLGNLEIASLLIESGADINATTEMGSALTMAIGMGHVEFVRFLLKVGVIVHDSHLSLAKQLANHEIVDLLDKH